MAKRPPAPSDEDTQVELICPACGYHLIRTTGRLRRDTPIVCQNCGAAITPDDGEPSSNPETE